MAKTIGFYGTGNMGRAMIQGLIQSKLYEAKDIWIYDVYQPIVDSLVAELGVTPTENPDDLAKNSDTIIFAVKPYVLPNLLKELAPKLTKEQILISVAAGVTLATIEGVLSTGHKIVRVMPNTPALVGEGMSAVVYNQNISEEEQQAVLEIFSSFGKAQAVSENLIDAVVGVSGSAPAYVYMFIEALADGAVLEGMPRQQAYEFAAQTVLGSAKMVLETNQHPGALKDMVTSPGGTTIAAVKTLEDHGFRSAVMNAVHAAAERNKRLS
ncbi:pyrroline-5-carboxylate reductase [Enterococcus sp. JM4C]|uniref:pyrroline-5-carboxylate reductase n=1 Tax=Candidatus Enterococcus huntleyi TaxID=1857217 RepID=UPI00137A35C6|nr:pyrroline-5-carboxylate reductase [Enterococcus sp. JM4C]KAF1298481.1 pyrroline-5-carboxylate reductase [Enterococcus sp. JM4C]